MRYLRVKWLHTSADYPVVLYSELDEEGWEKRKVEVFADGRKGFAPPDDQDVGTRLGIEPVPSIEEITADAQFKPSWITKDMFEELWMTKGRNNA